MAAMTVAAMVVPRLPKSRNIWIGEVVEAPSETVLAAGSTASTGPGISNNNMRLNGAARARVLWQIALV